MPSVETMRDHLQKKRKGRAKARLQDVDGNVLPATWSVLRWYACAWVSTIILVDFSFTARIIASCTAHLEELIDPEDRLSNVGTWHVLSWPVKRVMTPSLHSTELAAVPLHCWCAGRRSEIPHSARIRQK